MKLLSKQATENCTWKKIEVNMHALTKILGLVFGLGLFFTGAIYIPFTILENKLFGFALAATALFVGIVIIGWTIKQ